MKAMSPSYLILTDLDHTLLDDRGAAVARTTMRFLNRRGISVIPVTSKTAAETAAILRLWGISGPAIVENGAVSMVPCGTMRWHIECLYPFRYADLRRRIKQYRKAIGCSLRGFGDMCSTEISQLTGLTRMQASLARLRLASEPLRLSDSCSRLDLMDLIDQQDLRLISGGRFQTLIPREADKAVGVRRLLQQRFFNRPKIIAFGDAANDEQMLAMADIPICMPGPTPLRVDFPCLRGRHAGIEGWVQALMRTGVLS